jgi:hypothetical protein
MSDLQETKPNVEQEKHQDSTLENKQSHNEEGYEGEEHDGYDSGSESEYEEVNITENPLYQVLSVFFEDDNGRNLCDKLDDVREAINRNTQVQKSILKELTSNKK